jgi:hypothetical protein
LLLVMVFHSAYIDTFHYQVGQGLMVLFVMVFWIHYVHWAAS